MAVAVVVRSISLFAAVRTMALCATIFPAVKFGRYDEGGLGQALRCHPCMPVDTDTIAVAFPWFNGLL